MLRLKIREPAEVIEALRVSDFLCTCTKVGGEQRRQYDRLTESGMIELDGKVKDEDSLEELVRLGGVEFAGKRTNLGLLAMQLRLLYVMRMFLLRERKIQ